MKSAKDLEVRGVMIPGKVVGMYGIEVSGSRFYIHRPIFMSVVMNNSFRIKETMSGYSIDTNCGDLLLEGSYVGLSGAIYDRVFDEEGS